MEELRSKLVRLANGDVELVNRALWWASGYKRENGADLNKVIDFIVTHRK
jgi:hypothetical protein